MMVEMSSLYIYYNINNPQYYQNNRSYLFRNIRVFPGKFIACKSNQNTNQYGT